MKASSRYLLTKQLAAYASAVIRTGNSVERNALQQLAAEYYSICAPKGGWQPYARRN